MKIVGIPVWCTKIPRCQENKEFTFANSSKIDIDLGN